MYSGLIDTLVAKTRTWEDEHETIFAYDGVPLLTMLDKYAVLRHEKEEEKRKMRVSYGVFHQLIKIMFLRQAKQNSL